MMRCSSLGTLMGVNPFKTTYKMFMMDTGQVEEIVNEVAERRMRAGQLLEHTIIKMYEEQTGHTVKIEDEQTEVRKDNLSGHMDGWVTNLNCPIEIKNTTKNLGSCPEDMDRNYYSQIQGYMYLIDSSKAVFCYLKNGWDLHYFEVPRDDEYIIEMLEKIEWYELCLETGFFDEPVAEVKSKEFPLEVVTNTNLYELSREYGHLNTRIKELEAEKNEVKQDIQQILGDNFGKLEANDFILNYVKQNRKGSVDMKLLQEKHPEVDVEAFRKEGTQPKMLRIDLIDREEEEYVID